MKACRRVVLIAALILTAVAMLVPGASAAVSQHQVLVINSYHEGYSWTDGEVAGIRSILGQTPEPILSVEYLDWRRLPTQENRDAFLHLLQSRYGADRPDVVLTTDNPALDFVLDNRNALFPGVPIVFCGINNYQPSLLRGMTGITGVSEEIDAVGTLKLALQLHSHARRVFIITDFTETGLAVRQAISEATGELSSRVTLEYSPDVTLGELMTTVSTLPSDTIVLAGPFVKDSAGMFVDFPQLADQLAAHTSLPVYGLYEQSLGHGIIGGMLTSPQLEGSRAGQLVQHILDGEAADAIPVERQQSTRPAFDWTRLAAYHIPTSSLPAGSLVINRPVTLMDTDRRLAMLTVAGLVVLVAGMVFLAVSDVRRERAEAKALRLATAVEQSAEAIAITDPRGSVTYVNPAFERVTLRRAADALNHPVRELLGDEAAVPVESAGDVFATTGSWKKRISLTRSDGSTVDLDLTVSPVRGPDGGIANFTYVGRDITQESALEEQLRQSQKLEAIGMLAGGVAHDFNNILTGILGYANMLEPDAPDGSTMQEGLRVIQQAAERAAELSKQLLSFARRGKRESTSVDLNTTVLEVVSLLTRTINKNITVTEQFNTSQATVLGDAGQLQQVVLNLAINARDAMPDGGTLTFRTWRQQFSAEQLVAHPGAAPGTFVALSVSDTGRGIEKKNLRRIFEPFFTTKDPGKGTGMGLAMVYGIVKAHQGFIDVQSELGKGTTFTVYIPATDTPPVAVCARRRVAAGQATVLVVDDEEVVRKLASEMLRRAGYSVATAASADEATAWYKDHWRDIDLVIVDMVMPGKDGAACFEALKTINPHVRAILTTGYGLDGHAQDTLDAGMVGYLQKPYHSEDLVNAVEDALARDLPGDAGAPSTD